MDYRPIQIAEYEAVRQFLSELGWAERVADPARFAQMMAGANRTIVAWDGGRVVGFGRALCDEVSNGYLSMLAVATDKRGQGIGWEMVRHLTAGDPGITWVLRAGRESAAFWEKLGFSHSEIAMERTRR